MEERTRWNFCDQGCCYASNKTKERGGLNSGMVARCIRHGNILDYYPSYDGLTRAQAKARFNKSRNGD